MTRHYSKKHGFWLAPLLVVVLVPLATLATVRLQGWQWKGFGWRDGPTFRRITWRQDDCLRLAAHGVRLSGWRPLRVTMDSLSLPACPNAAALRWPTAAPAFDLRIWSLGIHEYPALQVRAHHRGTRWWGEADLQNSHLALDYDAADSDWRVRGAIEGAHLDGALKGRVSVAGSGVWTASRRSGRLTLSGGPGVGLDGEAVLSWKDGVLTVHPFSLARPDGAVVTLTRARAAPLADPGTLTLPLTVREPGGAYRTLQGRLSWGAGGLHWSAATADGRGAPE